MVPQAMPSIIVQEITAMPIYGKKVNVICHPYTAEILHYYSTNLPDAHIWSEHTFSRCKMDFFDYLAEYRLILANSSYGFVS